MTALHFPEDAALAVVRTALDEDLGPGTDVTTMSTIPAGQTSVSHLVARADGVVAGLPVVGLVLDAVDERLGTGRVELELHVEDGARVLSGDHLATLAGSTRTTLVAERTVLNVLSRTSGVATHTRRWADELEGSGAMVGRAQDQRTTAARACVAVAVVALGLGLAACSPDPEPAPEETTTRIVEDPSTGTTTETPSPSPTETPPASAAPLLAASMIPGPPPVITAFPASASRAPICSAAA